jgi:non-canonical purine NTP pyrophosphatase (RdgB/HAM1 family)
MQIRFATGNARKLGEARLGCAPFGITVRQVDVDFQEIQSPDPVEIALHKSRQAFEQVGEAVVVADTFWAIPALNGFPGAYMKEITRWFRPEDFINLLRPYADRRICLFETVVYRDASQHRVFAGEYWGEIVEVPRGDGLPIEEVAKFNGQTIAERRNLGKFSHDPEDFIWAEFAAWYVRLNGAN